MAAEFYSDYTRRETPQGSSLPMRLLDSCLALLSLLAGLALLLTLAVPFVAPAKVLFFPLLGLLAPGIYVLNIVLILYWIIRWRWIRAGVLLGVVLLGSFNLPLFYRMELRRTYGPPDYGRGTFQIVTFNVRGFYDDTWRSDADSIAVQLARLDPEIICFQEYNAELAGKSAAFQELKGRYSVVGNQGAESGPMLIMSKFPIVRHDTLPDFGKTLWADLQIGEEVVRIFSNHLHTTEIKSYDEEFISQRLFLTDSTRWAKFRSIVGRHRKNCELRAEQVERIAPHIAETPTRYIVCGDFNDTPVSYVYRTMARGTEDAFSECGRGYSHTYRGFFNALRIDYVLHSDGLEALSYEVPEIGGSDHLPVVVRLQKSESDKRTPK